MLLNKRIISWIGFIIISISVFSENDAYQKLFSELDRYEIVYDQYSANNFPVLSGNAEIGGLTDPLGRGVCNIEINDFYLNEEGRIAGPGFMVKPVQFAGLSPESFSQRYSLRNGTLTTSASYATGSFRSELFFSHHDSRLLVYSFENTGKEPLVCNVDLGQLDMHIRSFSDSTVELITPEGRFSTLHYSLNSNIPFRKTNFPNKAFLPWSKDIFITVEAGKKLNLTLCLTVGNDDKPAFLPSTDILRENNNRQWEANWRRIGFVVLPEGDFARTYYRSLHYLQCTAGGERNLPGECQFGAFSTRIANEYGMQINQNRSNITPWQQMPFTYGGAGWAALAYSAIGDKERASLMLKNFYRPQALNDNVAAMFKDYLNSNNNHNGFCFAHENLYDGRNHQVPPWDKQIHIQGFAPAMYAYFHSLYGEMSDTVYSVLKGCAQFWTNILRYDSLQKSYTLPPLLSVTEDLFEAGVIDGLLAARWTLSNAASEAKKRGEDKNLAKIWQKIAENIKIKPNKTGVYPEFTGDDGSRAGAGYMGIRGYVYLGFPTISEMKKLSPKAVAKSLDECWLRNRKGEGMITFIANWFALADAYWGRGEEAYEKALYSVSRTEANTSSMCEQNASLYYFLTGYASFVMVPTAMVLQTVDGEIRTFPAVPKVFSDIEFYNLPAKGGLRVSGVMKNGRQIGVWYNN